MIHFDTDYMEGAHPEVMRRLVETNLEQTPGYGCDDYTARAKDLIREACGQPQAAVQFLVGGTQTNATVIDALLARHEGVLGAESAHINVHEAGAIEATGHKVLTLPQYDGKVKAADVEAYIRNFYRDETYEHMVAPGMLYISHPTELGTLYTLRELEDLSRVRREANIPLYMDGARLANACAALNLSFRQLTVDCGIDILSFGGTKNGLMLGESVIIFNPALKKEACFVRKQSAQLASKLRYLSCQFTAYLTDDLWLKNASHANRMAQLLYAGLKELPGVRFTQKVESNQLFLTMSRPVIDNLLKDYFFYFWNEEENEIRFVTSFDTTEQDIEELLHAIRRYCH